MRGTIWAVARGFLFIDLRRKHVQENIDSKPRRNRLTGNTDM
jgi:hypothetical protein